MPFLTNSCGEPISPKSVAVEICHMQIVPRGLKCLVTERRAWVLTTGQNLACLIFNCDSVRSEDQALVLADKVSGHLFVAKMGLDPNLL
jgi:hypothetical protein